MRLPIAQTPLFYQFFTNLLFLCLKGLKASCSSDFFGDHSLVKAPLNMEKFNKMFMLLP